MSKFTICVRPHAFPCFYVVRAWKNFSLRKNLHIYGSATLAQVALMFSNVRGLSRDRNLKTNCRNCAKNCIEIASHVEHSKAFPERRAIAFRADINP